MIGDQSQDERMSRALTPAQSAVLELVGSGLTTKKIAARLAMSPATVETHVRAAIERLGTRTRLQAAARRLAVESKAGEREDAMAVVLQSDEHRLLQLLAAGATLTEASASMHISRRTCTRRLAVIKVKLGTQTTTEAVLHAVRDHASSLLAGVWIGLQTTADTLDVMDGLVALVCTAPF
jgi:DNA-binding NarL/FixJ family response regulator